MTARQSKCGSCRRATKTTGAQVQHRKLASKEDADTRKKFWDERLTALADTLKG
jgi:hypothetical protein